MSQELEVNQCLGIAVGQLGWEWSPVARIQIEVQGGGHRTIHSVASASVDECRSAFVKWVCQLNHYFLHQVLVSR